MQRRSRICVQSSQQEFVLVQHPKRAKLTKTQRSAQDTTTFNVVRTVRYPDALEAEVQSSRVFVDVIRDICQTSLALPTGTSGCEYDIYKVRMFQRTISKV